MANSKFDAKSFNPEAFKYMVGRVPNLTLNALKKSRALAGNPDIRAVFTSQNGTAYARLAMRGLLDGDAVNYDGETDITATSTKTFEQGMVVVGRAKAWTEKDFSYDITGGVDFMGNVSAQVAEYKDTLDQKTLLSILKGVFAMPTTDAKNKEFVEKHSTTIYAPMSATTLNSAVNKACGANKQKFSLVFMHSDVATNLENMKLLEFMKQTDGDGGFTVISAGGGLVLREENQRLLKENAVCVYLKASPGQILHRLQGDTSRPLLQGGNVREKVEGLMAARGPVYEKAADITVNTDGRTPGEIAREIAAFAKSS